MNEKHISHKMSISQKQVKNYQVPLHGPNKFTCNVCTTNKPNIPSLQRFNNHRQQYPLNHINLLDEQRWVDIFYFYDPNEPIIPLAGESLLN